MSLFQETMKLISRPAKLSNSKLPPRALISLLSTKLDWQIPPEKHVDALHDSSWSILAKNNKNIEISGAEKYPNLTENVKKYMKETFYKTAPIPKAIGLSNEKCTKQSYRNDFMKF